MRERQNVSGGGAEREREGDTESETGSRLWAVSTEPDAGLELTSREITTRAEVGRSADRATQALLTGHCFRSCGQGGSGETILPRHWHEVQERYVA